MTRPGGRAREVWRWAWGSLRYRRGRSLLAVLAVALPTALIASTIGFRNGYEASLQRNVDALGYQVLVTGKGCPHEAATLMLRGGAIPMYIRQPVYRHVVGQPEVRDATGFLLQSLPEPDFGAHQLYLGIDDSFRELRPGFELQRGDWFSEANADEAVLGFNVAEYQRLDLGDEIQVGGRALRVRGVVDQLGTQDDGTVFLPLEVAQQIFGKRDRLTGIGIRLHDVSTAGDLIERLYDVPSIQVVRMAQVQTILLDIVESVEGVILVFGAFCLFVAMVGVLNASLISVTERRREMGLLRALGCPLAILFALMLAETALAGIAGGIAGGALSVLAGNLFEWTMRSTLSFVPPGPVMTTSPAVLIASGGLAAVLCLLAGVYPAWRACRVPPMASIQRAVS